MICSISPVACNEAAIGDTNLHEGGSDFGLHWLPLAVRACISLVDYCDYCQSEVAELHILATSDVLRFNQDELCGCVFALCQWCSLNISSLSACTWIENSLKYALLDDPRGYLL